MNKNVFLLMCVAGAALMFAGILLDWMSISVLFTDGTRQTITATGLEMLTDYYGKGMPISIITPALYVLLAIVVLLLTARCWMAPETTTLSSASFFMAVIFAVMFISGAFAVESSFMVSDPTGTLASGIPTWLTDLVGDDVYSASLSSENGRFASLIGVIVAWLGMLFLLRDDSEEQAVRAVEEGY